MYDHALVVTRAIITVPVEKAADVEGYLRGPAQQSMVSTAGFVFRELYRGYSDDQPTVRLLRAHGWRSLSDMDRFRRADVSQYDTTLNMLGATVERFAGQIADQFSRLDRLNEA
jgi:hypothetical protein